MDSGGIAINIILITGILFNIMLIIKLFKITYYQSVMRLFRALPLYRSLQDGHLKALQLVCQRTEPNKVNRAFRYRLTESSIKGGDARRAGQTGTEIMPSPMVSAADEISVAARLSTR